MEYGGIKTLFTVLVPASGNVILYNAEVMEIAGKRRNVTLYFATRPAANLTEHTSYGYADKDEEFGGIYYPHFAYNPPTEYGCLYFKSEKDFDSYAVSVKDFCGEYGDFASPDGL